jgi:GR25 family glycosyltransferase involved in LPS biosynthesis
MKFFDYIAKIIYINLDHRKDRDSEINMEFERLGIPKEKIERFSAIQDNNGAIGCTKSHVAVIEKAIKENYENILVLEDDFNFIKNVEKINHTFDIFFANLKDSYDVFQLSRGYKYERCEKIIDEIYKVNECSTTSGYLVNQRAYAKLLQNYKKGLLLYKSNQDKPTEYSLDVFWKHMQKNSNWYVNDPFLGYQRTSFSDIGNIYINYSSVNGLEEQNERNLSVKLCGGLGNQMFQIATLYSVAKDNNMIPIVKDLKSSPSVFNDRPVYFSNMLRKIKNIHPHYYDGIKLEKVKEQSFEYSPIDFLNDNKSYELEGYYQSYKYFEKNKKMILELFDLGEKEKQIAEEFKKLSKIQLKISLHVRRGDYLKLSNYHVNLNMNYYKTAMSYMNDDDVVFIVFSDDIEWCRQNFENKNCVFVEGNYDIELPEEVVHLKFMSLCDHNIIANSSFSWWGAWLNMNDDKVVITPSKWFVSENMCITDLIPENWKKISI